MARPEKIAKGKARMKQLGCKVVEVWLDSRERHLIQAAAEAAGLKLSTYIRTAACRAAEEHAHEQFRRSRAEPT